MTLGQSNASLSNAQLTRFESVALPVAFEEPGKEPIYEHQIEKMPVSVAVSSQGGYRPLAPGMPVAGLTPAVFVSWMRFTGRDPARATANPEVTFPRTTRWAPVNLNIQARSQLRTEAAESPK